jgi:hypothetical protein
LQPATGLQNFPFPGWHFCLEIFEVVLSIKEKAMYNYLTGEGGWMATIALLGICFLIILLWTKRRSFPTLFKDFIPRLLLSKATEAPHYFNEIIDIPQEENHERDQSEMASVEESNEDDLMEMVVGAESVLLQEAESVVNELEGVITNFAASPSSEAEMYGKIKSIVSCYSLFQDTEYYEAINNFIRIVVSRECNLKWSDAELHALWG